jgi:hypothetical protein
MLSTTLRSGAGEDEIERICREFEDAKRNYLSIPAAIKDMPKQLLLSAKGRFSLGLSLTFLGGWRLGVSAFQAST